MNIRFMSLIISDKDFFVKKKLLHLIDCNNAATI